MERLFAGLPGIAGLPLGLGRVLPGWAGAMLAERAGRHVRPGS
jgi:hypothetical protein